VSGGNLTVTNGAIGDYPLDNNIYLPAHGFQTGDLLRYNKSGSGAAIGGLTPGQNYYAISVGTNELELATAGTAFDGSNSATVDLTNNTILTSGCYQMASRVIYRNGGGTSLAGLTDLGIYSAGAVSPNTVKL